MGGALAPEKCLHQKKRKVVSREKKSLEKSSLQRKVVSREKKSPETGRRQRRVVSREKKSPDR
jgi:hypothetical protein